MKTTVVLENMEFYAYHGCYDLERKVGMRFSVDLWIDARVGDAAAKDDIGGLINYLTVFEIVRAQMEIPSHTIEHAASRILDAVFEKFPAIESAKVKLSKLAPSLGGKVGKASVIISRGRGFGQ